MRNLQIRFSVNRAFLAAAVALAGLQQPLAFAASNGGLDPTFDPQPQEVPASTQVITVGRDVFLNASGVGLMRFQENGRLDASWHLSAPAGGNLVAVAPMPFGGWVVANLSSGFFDYGDGTYRRFSVSAGPLTLYPQGDGSVLIPGTATGVSRYTPEGVRDPAYARGFQLTAANFNDDAGTAMTGGPFVVSTGDSLGRMVLVGNFRSASGAVRLGLVRRLADGTVDSSWNPGLALGIELLGTNELNAVPAGIYPGPNNSILIILQLKSTNGIKNLRMATIDEGGAVTASFAVSPVASSSLVLVQPDGRILVRGPFMNWLGSSVTGMVRLETDGSVDPGFHVELTGNLDYGGMALDSLGRLVLAGPFDSVNGVPRPGLARVFAYDPPPLPPSAAITVSRPRIATNEVLYLAASVAGFPPPDLQWYRNGVLIPGATNTGLRVVVGGPADVGEFRLMASNTGGSTNLDYPIVSIAVHSPKPGTIDPLPGWSLTNFTRVHHLVSLPDGRVLVGGGSYSGASTNSEAMVACLMNDGSLDPEFGNGGLVSGNGFVETLRVLPDGHILLAGAFTDLAAAAASGLAELDAAGARVPRAFPALDVAHASVILPLPSGGYVVAGRFEKVGGIAAHRLARLTAAFGLDPAFQSPLEAWQFVDDLALDAQGRLLIGGARIYTDVTLTNPIPAGLQRLLPDGSRDPAFSVQGNWVRSIFVEKGGSLMIGPELRRLTADGQSLLEFDRDASITYPSRAFDPDHTVLRLPDGGGAVPLAAALTLGSVQLARWQGSGRRDYSFEFTFPSILLEAGTVMPDGSILVSKWDSSFGLSGPRRRLARIPPDADTRLINIRLVNDRLWVDLATQPGRHYEIRRATDVSSGTSTLVGEVDGDGYVQQISTPSDTGTLFVTLRRQ